MNGLSLKGTLVILYDVIVWISTASTADQHLLLHHRLFSPAHRFYITVCNMLCTVICSGPLPAYRGDEIHSRLSSLNGWMSKWCPQNSIGFIDNWMSFWGRPDLLKRDGVHPSWVGAALLSRNLAHSLRVHT